MSTHNQNPNLPRTQGPQTVITPPYLMNRLRSVWETITLDPCAAPKDLPTFVNAKYAIRLPDDGLKYKWPDRTFVNPPYKFLKDWTATYQLTDPDARVAWLVPLRSHRKWWLRWAVTSDVIIALAGVKFHGYSAKFPAPVGLVYFGYDHGEIVDAFSGVGAPTRWGA